MNGSGWCGRSGLDVGRVQPTPCIQPTFSTQRLNVSDLHKQQQLTDYVYAREGGTGLDTSNTSKMSNVDRDVRQEARAIMIVVRHHDQARRRQHRPPPHTTWGCDLGCLPRCDHLGDALTLALTVGGIVLTPDHRYAPGWMRPA